MGIYRNYFKLESNFKCRPVVFDSKWRSQQSSVIYWFPFGLNHLYMNGSYRGIPFSMCTDGENRHLECTNPRHLPLLLHSRLSNQDSRWFFPLDTTFRFSTHGNIDVGQLECGYRYRLSYDRISISLNEDGISALRNGPGIHSLFR